MYLVLINTEMSASNQKIRLPEEQPQFCVNRCSEKAALRAEVESANAQYVDYLKQMISSLLENQMNLSAALDETRETCAQLNLQKSELEAAGTQEVQVLQAELSMCRQREAELMLAYEDLRSRVEAIDQVIEQIPWLDVLFNSDGPLPTRLKALKCEDDSAEAEVPAAEQNASQAPSTLHSVRYDAEADAEAEDDEDEAEAEADIDAVDGESTPHHHVPLSAWRRSKRAGSASPLSDSGCTSESHDEISLASLNSAHSSPHLAVLRGRLEAQQRKQPNDGVRMRKGAQQIQLKRSATSAIEGANGGRGWRLGKITESLRASISRFADKSGWKMEALAARQREARALVLLNETQAEVRKVESRCKGLTRRQNEQELRMNEKEREIERLLSQERDLRRDLRNWQQRVFQLETETQEIRHNYQIAELEMKSRLLEATMLASDPTAKAVLQNPATLFSEDLLRLKLGDEAVTPTSVTNAFSSQSNAHLREDAGRPPKFARPSLQGRPRFASTTSLSRLPLTSPCQMDKTAPGIKRPVSSQHLDQPSGGGEEVACRMRDSQLTTSFGSLSELELKPDV